MAYDNVIIFGAGVSVEAGIPLLTKFVDTMWGYAIRGRSPHGPLTQQDKEVLAQADKIRTKLESYNARANFNLRNVEAVMSLLSVDAFGGIANHEYNLWLRAIARTIELSCTFPDPSKKEPTHKYPHTTYHEFWNVLLNSELRDSPPALITFNYDLVLERTLHQFFHHLPDSSFKPAEPTCKIAYALRPYDFSIFARPSVFPALPRSNVQVQGLIPEVKYDLTANIEIPYLKLHGSLNWSASKTPPQDQPMPDNLIPGSDPFTAQDDPLILPPVFNKLSSPFIAPVWRRALEILREAKHIIIVGYSLPRTDIYMQYFLKSAVGPNSNLQYITVFNPVLFRNDNEDAEMRARYRDCFSPQFNERIIFQPPAGAAVDQRNPLRAPGTFFHFTQLMKYARKDLLFVP